jgi:predicted ATPase
VAIKRLSVSNFKSFEYFDIELGNFNVVVGPNASGKSNFVQVIKFIKDILTQGLDNAVALQGNNYLPNISLTSNNVRIGLLIDAETGVQPLNAPCFKFTEFFSEFELEFFEDRRLFKIIRDRLEIHCQVLENFQSEKAQAQGKIIVTRVGDKIDWKYEFPEEFIEPASQIASFPGFSEFKQNILIFLQIILTFQGPRRFQEWNVYSFDPKLSKKAIPLAGIAEFEPDGSNLALVLKRLLANPEKKREFKNLFSDLLPFVHDIKVSEFTQNTLMLELSEKYNKNKFLPANLLSDGTIYICALITALCLEDTKTIIFEEPEHNIHPYVIAGLVHLMKDVARNKQIIITTHNPEVVRHAGLENLILVSRDEKGFSTVSKPAEKEAVRAFLKHDLGVEDLFVQDLLGMNA